MKVLGLTGGIGSGKSTIAKEFKKLGVPVFIADDESKKILQEDNIIIKKVENLLGKDAYHKLDGIKKPNREYIASKVFSDSTLLSSLNSILHPAVGASFEKWKSENKESTYIVYEAAILFETGGDDKCDYILLVAAPQEERINRVILRDNISEEQVLQRMSKQWEQKEKVMRSNLIICNLNINETKNHIKHIHQFMLNR